MHKYFVMADAENSAAVVYQTFGHLDAKPGESHTGSFVFINGQHGDMCVVISDFPSFGEGPGYFNDRSDFIWGLIRDNGPCSKTGIYRFVGDYRLPASESDTPGFFGTVTTISYE